MIEYAGMESVGVETWSDFWDTLSKTSTRSGKAARLSKGFTKQLRKPECSRFLYE